MFKAPFSFDGRIRRIEYFLSGLISGVVTSLVYLLCFTSALTGGVSGIGFAAILGVAVVIAAAWFGIAQGVKRLHDLNKSGWLILLCWIPVVGWIFALYMLFADGTVGPNQYGEDPKNRMPYQGANINVTVNINGNEKSSSKSQSSETEEKSETK